MEAIGGFFASLDLLTKEKSFKDGIKHLDNVGKSLNGMASFAMKAFSLTGSGLLALTAITSAYEAKNYMLAYSLHMSSEELQAFKGAADIAGASGDGLAQALLNLQHKSDRLKLGEVDVGLAKSLGMLGIGYQGFLKENSADKMKTVFSQAMKMTDKGEAGELIRDVLGDAGFQMWKYTQMTGQSLDTVLNKSRALQFTNDRTTKNAMMFNQEVKTTGMMFGSMGSLFFSTFGAQMIPVLQGLEKLILKNKALISSNIIKFATELGTAAKWLFGALETGIPKALDLIDKLGGIENVAKGLIGVFIAFNAIKTGANLFLAVSNISKAIGMLKEVSSIETIANLGKMGLALGAIFGAFELGIKILNMFKQNQTENMTFSNFSKKYAENHQNANESLDEQQKRALSSGVESNLLWDIIHKKPSEIGKGELAQISNITGMTPTDKNMGTITINLAGDLAKKLGLDKQFILDLAKSNNQFVSTDAANQAFQKSSQSE